MTQSATPTPLPAARARARALLWLILNHLDNWGSTLIIALLALVVHNAVGVATLHLALALVAGYWLAFALNDFYDAPFDALAPRKARRNYFVAARMNKRLAVLAGTLLLFIAAGFLQFGGRGVALLAVSLFVMWSYSAPPLRWKSRPVADLLVHAGFVQTYPYVVILLAAGMAWRAVDGAILLSLGLASMTAQLEQQLRDYSVDVQSGGTFVTWFGRRRSRRLLSGATAVLLLVSVLSVVLGIIPLYIGVYGLIAAPALVHRFWRGEAPRSERLIFALTIVALLYTIVLIMWWVTVSRPALTFARHLAMG